MAFVSTVRQVRREFDNDLRWAQVDYWKCDCCGIDSHLFHYTEDRAIDVHDRVRTVVRNVASMGWTKAEDSKGHDVWLCPKCAIELISCE